MEKKFSSRRPLLPALYAFVSIFAWIAATILPASIAYGQLSIDSCQIKARKNYPLIKRYDLIERAKAYNLSNACKGHLPQISMTARISYQSEVTKIPVNLPGIDIEGLSKDQYLATVDVTQAIWDGGTIRSQKKITVAGSEMEQRQLEVDLYAIEEQVNQLFFGILLLDAQLRQNEILQEDLQRNHTVIASYIENGIANQADLDAVKVEQLKAKQLHAQLYSNRKAYIEMLTVMIGEPIGETSILIKPDIRDIPLSMEIHRPELKLFESQHNLLEAQKSMIAASYMPRFNLFLQGGYGKPGLNMLDNDFSPFYIGGLRMSWNFGALYTQKNDRRKLEVNQNNVTAQTETFLYHTHLEIARETNEIKKLKEIMEYDAEIIRLRENVKKAAEIKVANGTLSVIELVREINSENLAKQEKNTHEIELLIAVYKLKNTTNR